MMRKNRLKQIVAIAFIMAGAAKISLAQPIEETTPGSTPGDLGTVKFNYGGNEVTYTTVRAKDDNVWLQQNLGSSRVATGRVDGQSFGDLFQWGRWDDGHHLRDGAVVESGMFTPNNPTGINSNKFYFNSTAASMWWAGGGATDKVEADKPDDVTATNGCDPCKKLIGGDWRLPTQAEWDALRAVEAITNADAAYASLLKLPSANPRFGNNGTLQGNNNTTRYWSGTAGANGGAIVLNFTYTGANAGVASTANISRAQGYAIRCINKPVVTPVGFINFKGKKSSLGINLEWTVSSEHNNAYYTVKHSVNGVFFKNLKDISGRGNSSVQQSYTYLHSNPVTGANYYKLSQTDLDGTERELSTISVIGTSLGESAIIINAADQSVNVELAGFYAKPKKISISSISGQKIYEGRIADNSVMLPLALQKGVYVAHVDFEDNTSKTVKFIK